MVWGEGGVKERGGLCPEYFTPPPRQVRGLEEAVVTRHISWRRDMLNLGKRITGSPSQPWGGAMASLAGREDAPGRPGPTWTPTHEGGGALASPGGCPGAGPLASQRREGVVYLPVVSKQLMSSARSSPYMWSVFNKIVKRK